MWLLPLLPIFGAFTANQHLPEIFVWDIIRSLEFSFYFLCTKDSNEYE